MVEFSHKSSFLFSICWCFEGHWPFTLNDQALLLLYTFKQPSVFSDLMPAENGNGFVTS